MMQQQISDRIQEVLPVDVAKCLEQGDRPKIIDVREDFEVAEGMIDGALHVPMRDLLERYQEWKPEEELIFVCRSGRRSLAACQVMKMIGYHNVKNLAGGMRAYGQ
ncbi:rhodanese-like domain-containing protein [Tumebacillus permanentifrigoris]|uniref:Rhodanese-related sulfurtransferase n=1 Tax=Tumebacillus permanentifrigoris TaxID=378543 RepID=A0A316DFB3_9BACL|nr:rhodanese-like domain-containing protein [Tumebacillus permanentifrigoris]PWK14924.1 rhodanese-related sulfurtransferase [Tumebacillus permanentifrigoris]